MYSNHGCRCDVCSTAWSLYGKSLTRKARLHDELVEALKGLVESASSEANEKGLGGFHAARLADARHVLSRVAGGE